MTDWTDAQSFNARESEVGEGASRDDESFELDAVYRQHAADVSRWLRRLAGQDDVADLLHEVFVVAQRRIAQFRGESSLRTWLYAIAVRVVSAWRRKQRLRRLFFGEPNRDADAAEPIDAATPLALIESKRAGESVYRVLDRLSERDRTLIVMFELEEWSAADIQAVLGLAPNGVWVALHRARARFRRVFVELYGSEE